MTMGMITDSDAGRIDRRDVLGGGGAVIGGMVSGLFGGARPARAQAISGGVPEVDRATVRVVTDNYHFALSPSGMIGDVEVGRTGFALSDAPPEKALQSEFGLSLHLETQRAAETRKILIDFGYSSPTLLNNMAILGIDASELDAMVLSHGHFDHFGGMVGFFTATQGKRRPGLPFYLGGEECFCTRQLTVGPSPKNFGALDRQAIDDANLEVLNAEGPSILADHAFVTGHIGKATFERVLSPTRMKVGVDGGLGCFPDQMPADRRADDWAPDEFGHEISTCVNVKGRGLVVTTSCGHRGIVNTVKRAMAVSGVRKVHAVLGGFHLAPHDEAYVRKTIDELVALDVDHIIPMHCTGEMFYEILKAELPSKLIRSYTGTKLVFGA
ncbi:MBL fold metallo-hydrolase [Rubrimonas cliftonensis]|uniref:7,8-dihydropterin-6-yl-methyl-4-(Beta-D-ribofuranosyl)aminobenzene 5'-phosphate synthase n=1 Tax=Rubrimonas cliftonensis TaxID=89524 RepID=A0A1H4FB67_9RHOB|nr:MBL fold metallo-hydrolase [Rubrimonas cliftonensis]SEA94566.1 7,8-dihydropterin-6-yl-methyl-4-(beta-D-ribofuranosyl)aminobenzene 5'-phosphate synthase [Rubrimonas cliftonensis]